MLAELDRYQTEARKLPQTRFLTQHALHGGMYARTITMPPWTRIVGALVKVPTLVITVGSGLVSVGRELKPVDGYKVLPASAGRKQVFVTLDKPLVITALFVTDAKTVEEAEREFTDEYDLLLSHEQDNEVLVSGE